MLNIKPLHFILVCCFILLSACEKPPITKKVIGPQSDNKTSSAEIISTEERTGSDITEIGWDNLIPDEWRPDSELIEKYNNGDINDDDPRVIALRKKMQELEKLAPLNKTLEGKIIKMPGFVVPVEMDGEKVREFLLVPYQGACVHVPPPPANQTVYVKTNDESSGVYTYFDTVWVTGTMSLVKTKNDLAESGYMINAVKVEPYE